MTGEERRKIWGILEKDLNSCPAIWYMVKQMEISQNEEEVKKLSQFLSEAYISNYNYGNSLHIPGKVTYISFDNPMEVNLQPDDGVTVRVLTDNGKVYIEIWKGVDGITYNINTSSVKLVYRGGRLEIAFTGE